MVEHALLSILLVRLIPPAPRHSSHRVRSRQSVTNLEKSPIEAAPGFRDRSLLWPCLGLSGQSTRPNTPRTFYSRVPPPKYTIAVGALEVLSMHQKAHVHGYHLSSQLYYPNRACYSTRLGNHMCHLLSSSARGLYQVPTVSHIIRLCRNPPNIQCTLEPARHLARHARHAVRPAHAAPARRVPFSLCLHSQLDSLPC